MAARANCTHNASNSTIKTTFCVCNNDDDDGDVDDGDVSLCVRAQASAYMDGADYMYRINDDTELRFPPPFDTLHSCI